MAGSDARELIWELSRERLSEDDIVSQRVHHCYVRATVGSERLPAFSMTVAKPRFGNPEHAQRIRAAASAYTTPLETIEAQHPERIEVLERLRKQSRGLKEEEPAPLPEEPKPAKRKKQRSKLVHRTANSEKAQPFG